MDKMTTTTTTETTNEKMIFLNAFGKRIKECREVLQLSQDALAQRLGYKSRTSINKIEVGKNDIPLSSLFNFAKVLNTTPMYLMGLDENETANAAPIQTAPDIRRVPLLGRIACGAPILAQENIEGYVSVPASIRCDFALTCKGDSMINANINDGDIVCIKSQQEVSSGEIAAVRIEDEATLKRVYKNGDSLILQPENPAFSPLVFVGEEMNNIEIIGKAMYFISVNKIK